MPTKKEDRVKYYSPDGDKTKYLENQDLPARLKTAYDKKKNFTMPTAKQTGSGDRKAQVAKRQAKTKTYLERKRGSTPKPRTTAGGPSQATQPVRQVRNTAPTSDYLRSTSPAQTFAQNGQTQSPSQYRPMMPQYGFDAMPPGQPMQQQQSMQPRPSAFGQPNSAMTMGIPPNPYGMGWNPTINPWGKRW